MTKAQQKLLESQALDLAAEVDGLKSENARLREDLSQVKAERNSAVNLLEIYVSGEADEMNQEAAESLITFTKEQSDV